MKYGCGWLLLWSLWSGAALATLSVTHLTPQNDQDKRDDYPLAVLQLALAESGVEHRLNPVSYLNQGRALKLLEQRQGVDVVWSMTSSEREAKLRPIRFPIDKGLIGWRVLLVREAQLPLFHNAGLDLLRQLIAGQGHDWPDLQILKGNGFKVMPSSDYEALFALLAKDRIQYFPRSVNEVMDEWRAHPDMQLAIEPSLLLHYPAAIYFFVHPDNELLAQTLELGLERALANGKFDALFNQMHGPLLAELNIGQRRIIELNNPLLPAATPVARRALWLQPQQFDDLVAQAGATEARSRVDAEPAIAR